MIIVVVVVVVVVVLIVITIRVVIILTRVRTGKNRDSSGAWAFQDLGVCRLIEASAYICVRSDGVETKTGGLKDV